MRFQKYLKVNRYKPYKYHYLDYEILRNQISKISTQEDEEVFKSLLDENINRVFGFIEYKQKEFSRRIKSLISKSYKKNNGDKGRDKSVHKNVGKDKGRDKSDYKGKNVLTDKNTININLIFNQITEEMKNFSEFIRINIRGFKKIIKRHDHKIKGYNLVSKKYNDLLNTPNKELNNYKTSFLTPLYKPILKEKIKGLEDLDELIYNSSKIILQKVSTKSCKSPLGLSLSFIRKTDKFWVHKDNLNSLKFYIVQHLPIYVYGESYDKWCHKTHDNRVSSVYLDNHNFDLYTGRLHKLQGAEAIRIRWYGLKIPNIVFIERKRHEEDWTGELSKKMRFRIYEKDVNLFLNGKDVYDNVKNLNEEDVYDLYKEIQEKVISMGLRPVVRTFIGDRPINYLMIVEYG